MDPATLAAAVTSFLAPYLVKAGGAVLDRASAALPDAVVKLWDKITGHFADKPAAAAVTSELAQAPADEDKQAAFALQLKMALKDDPEFAAAIQDLVKQAGGTQGGHNINVTTGNVSGSAIVFGNNNSTDVKS